MLLLAGTFEAFDEARARAARADGHIAKPFESQALINKVKELVEGKARDARRRASGSARRRAPRRPRCDPLRRSPPRPPRLVPRRWRGRPPGPGMPPGARPPGPGMPPGARPGPGLPPGADLPAPPARRAAAPRRSRAAAGSDAAGRSSARSGNASRCGARPARRCLPGAPRPPRRGCRRAPGRRDLSRPAPARSRPAHPHGPRQPPARMAPAAVPLRRRRRRVPPARRDPFGLTDAVPTPARAPALRRRPPPVRHPPVRPVAAPVVPEPSWEDLTEPEAPSLEVSLDDGLPRPPRPRPAVSAAPPPQAIELPDATEDVPELAPMHAFVPPAATTGHQPEPAAGGTGEAALREALSKASREVIERVVWEVVPQLAETIIRENLDRLVKAREG